jgi:dienelactone hydrolase
MSRSHATLLFALVTASVAGAQTIRVAPRWTTMDAPIRIRATSLPTGSPVTIRASMVDRAGQRWESHAVFTANSMGVVDVANDASIEGSYEGVEAEGLITHALVAGDSAGIARFEARWSDTVMTVFSLEIEGAAVSSDTLKRTFGPGGVVPRRVTEGGLVGTLFEDARGSKRPGVLVLGGSEGGDGAADVAYQLAGHGFTTMSLAYFGEPSLPQQLDEIPLEYFQRALDFLARRPTAAGPVGIVGTSKGAEAALIVAAISPAVRAVVAYAPSSVAWSCICDSASHSSWTVQGRPLPAVAPGVDPGYVRPVGAPIEPVVNYRYRLGKDTTSAALIRADRISAPVLLIAGDDDRLWPSADMTRQLARTLSRQSISNGSRVLIYPGAGHLIGKSILPAGSTRVARGRIQTGGSSAANAAAARDAWMHTVSFLEQNLSR